MRELIRGRYEELEVVGSGGQGRVIKALDHLHDRTVALKRRTMHDQAEREALLAEAGVLFRLPPSPHLPIVREDFFDGNDYVIVMDWVEGTDLSRILHTDGRPGLPPTLVLQWLADAAAALTHLHLQDPPVLHGDIKPANMIVTRGGRVSLVDFGASSTPSTTGRRGGTPGFAAPERATEGICSRASDVYSLAATAFALLTGEPPSGIRPAWEGIEPSLAGQFEAAIRKGLATNPERRLATPGELVELMRSGFGSTLPSGVLTFCFTDVVGSTAMWEDHPVAMSRALVTHDKTVAAAVERRGGRLIGSMGEGDSTVSVFPSPSNAVAAAVDLTRDLASTAWPPQVSIRVRAGLHTGEAQIRDGNYFGITLNTAARIRGFADAEQIFLSGETAALVGDHLPEGASLVDLGPASIRGRRDRIHVYALSAPGVDAPPPATECPYPGLLAFEAGNADHFHGRTAIVDQIVNRLRAHPFIAVVGASGSGKSSLLRAGVADRWLSGVDVITPSSSDHLSEEFLKASDRLLIVDQFEELVTQVADEDRRTTFVAHVLGAPRPLALALRADFYGSFAGFPDLAVALAGHQVLLGPMKAQELREAIEQPAFATGLRLEPGLVELLIAEVQGEPGALPLLAHALRTTWEHRDGRTLTIDAYHAAGGVRGAIAATADELMGTLDDPDRAIAKQIALRLVEPGDGSHDTRRRASLTELRPASDTEGRADRVIEALAARRLVSIDAGTVELAHEALIREWPRLQSWLADQRDDLRVQRQVTDAAQAWASAGREPTELYRGPRLAAAVDWLDRHRHASELEADFIRESAAEEDRTRLAQTRANRRLRAALVGVGVALVVAIIGGAVAVGRSRDAAEARDHADVARLAALSRSLIDRQPAIGLLLSVEAFRREDSHETRSTLLAALQRHPLLDGLVYGAESGLEAAAFTPDGATLATAASDGTTLWDVATRRRIATLSNADDVVLDASVSPDGRIVAAATVSQDEHGNPASHLQVWDLQTRELLHRIVSPAGGLTTAAFTADGRVLVTQGGVFPDRPPRLTAVLWDTETWQPSGGPWVLREEYLDDKITFLSGDGKVLAILDGAGATVFDVAARTERRHIPADAEVTALALSSDGALLAVGLESGAVHIVDTRTGATLSEAVSGSDAPTSMDFSPDDAVLAVASVAGRTQLVDVTTGAPLGPPLAASSAAVNDVSFSDDGSMLATAGFDRTGAIWKLDGDRSIGRSFAHHEAIATHVDVTSDGGHVVSAGADGTVVVRKTTTGKRRAVSVEGEVLSLVIHPSDEAVVVGTTNGDVRVLSLPDLRSVGATTYPGASIDALSVSPRTGHVAVGVNSHPGEEDVPLDDTGFVAIWDPDSGRETAARIAERGGAPVALAWTPDGATLVAVSDNNVLRLYRPGASYEQQGDDIVIEDDPMGAVAISPDGSKIAVGTNSGTVRQFQIASHEPFGPALRGLTFQVRGVAYSPDGSLLAATTTGLSTTRLWDVATGAPLGDELVAGRVPYTVRTLPIDRAYPSRPSFAADGSRLHTPVGDGSVVAWDLRPTSWVRAACELTGRNLTESEWRQYVGDDAYRETCSSR